MAAYSVSEYNRRIHELLNLARKGEHRNCLFTNQCTEKVIDAHSVPRAVLRTIQDDGHVIQPEVKDDKDAEGRSRPAITFNLEGIGVASTGTFACQRHDNVFKEIDTVFMDLEDPNIRNLLLYRAVIREIWRLFALRPSTKSTDQALPSLHRSSIHPETRLKTLFYLRDAVMRSLANRGCTEDMPRVVHMVRRVRSPYPILAASCASGGSMLLQDAQTGELLPDSYARSHLSMEPYTCWGLTIIPQEDAHMALFSWLEGSAAETYFTHVNEVQGSELEAAISAELILFCENWFLRPKVWEGYGATKRDAIWEAYNNVNEMLSGQYMRWDRNPKKPWYEYLKLGNRHQINLFRYDQSVLG